jgi:hypothetical protein
MLVFLIKILYGAARFYRWRESAVSQIKTFKVSFNRGLEPFCRRASKEKMQELGIEVHALVAAAQIQ